MKSFFLNKSIKLILLFLICIPGFFSQGFVINGDAFGIPPFDANCPSDTCFTMTRAVNGQKGAVYYKTLLDLNLPFDGTFCLFFGSNNSGADGLAFVLKDTSAIVLGGVGQGLGYAGISPSVAIEFDTFNNSGADILLDHTALAYNGLNLTPVVPAISLGNVEDGMPHTARLVWTPHDTTLYLYFDNTLMFSHKVDLINTIFGGVTKVNWGFTSSTGGLNNLQQICFPKITNTYYFDTVCQYECIDFAEEIYDAGILYSWSNDILDTLPNIRICPDSTTTYLLFKKDTFTGVIDTVSLQILVEKLPELNLGNDTTHCDGSLILNGNVTNGLRYLWSTGSTTDKIVVDDPELYWVEVSTDFCLVRDSIIVQCVKLPNVFSPNEDEINDYFSPIKFFNLDEATFIIYNRWGSVVYQSTNLTEIKKGWNGKFNNEYCSAGVYYYTLSYIDNISDKSENIKGLLHLFR